MRFHLLIFVVSQLLSDVKGECHLPSGSAGLCVDISRCAHLTKLISNLQKPFPSDVSLLIRDSFLCQPTQPSSQPRSVSVCCPLDGLVTPLEDAPVQESRDSCAMQQGKEARCVTYNQCSPFLQLLINIKKPLDPVVPRMIRSSYLCGVEETGSSSIPKICCPTAALPSSSSSSSSSDNKLKGHPGIRYIADSKTCGQSTMTHTRIVGGDEAPIGKFPWLVNLGYQQVASQLRSTIHNNHNVEKYTRVLILFVLRMARMRSCSSVEEL